MSVLVVPRSAPAAHWNLRASSRSMRRWLRLRSARRRACGHRDRGPPRAFEDRVRGLSVWGDRVAPLSV